MVLVVFGDNANLSASAAKTIGALLQPSVKDDPVAAEIRRELECFLDDQAPGYARLYDAQVGQFYFGWDATRDRLFGWEGLQGQWVPGHMDYLVNEFRAPAMFVTLRFGMPLAAIENLGFKMKPYRLRDGRELHALAPWEGSSFQALGMGVWLTEPDRPSWRRLLQNVVALELDYAERHGLPGFLSESYTGRGLQYTGNVGIPEIAVSLSPRITDVASLYTLGPAYTVAPEAIERFLAANWPVIQQLLTDHGPWEGYNVSTREVIPFQTTAHTLGLALGLLGTASDHMERYLATAGLAEALNRVFAPGPPADLLSGATQVFAWHAGQSEPADDPGGGVLPRAGRSGREPRGRLRLESTRGREPLGRSAASALPLGDPSRSGGPRPEAGRPDPRGRRNHPHADLYLPGRDRRPPEGAPLPPARHAGAGPHQGGRPQPRPRAVRPPDRPDRHATGLHPDPSPDDPWALGESAARRRWPPCCPRPRVALGDRNYPVQP